MSVNTNKPLLSSLRLTSALVLCGLTGLAQAAPFTYVVNRYDNNVSVVDLASNSIVSTIPAGMTTPHEIAINSDGSRAYLTSTWSNVVSVLDLQNGTLQQTISLNNSGTDVALSASGDAAYVGVNTYPGATIAVIDTATNQISRTISSGLRNSMAIALHPNGSRLYALELQNAPSTGRVAAIDLASNTAVDYMGVGTEPQDIKVSPNGSFAYVVNRDSAQPNGNVTVIDTRTNTVAATIPVGQYPSGVSFNPAGSQAYVTNAGDNTVSVIDTTSHAVVGSISVGNNPKHVTFNPSGSRAYVTNQTANTMSIIDTTTQLVRATVPVGSDPWGIAFAGETVVPAVSITTAPDITPANQAQYAIAGTCTPGAGDVSIQLTDGSVTIGPVTSTCSPTGEWTVNNQVVGSLADGTISISAAQTDIEGTTASSRMSITKLTAEDSGAPAVSITSAPAITLSNQAQYTIAGTCTPGAGDVRIQLADGSVTIGPLTSTCSPTGQWTLSNLAANTLADGPITITAEQTNSQGATGSSQMPTTKDTAEVIEGGGNNPGNVQAVPVSGVWAGLLLMVAGLGAIHRKRQKLQD